MPATPNLITVNPGGMTCDIDITDSYGTSVTSYTTSGGASTHTLPLSISAPTAFYLTTTGVHTVTAAYSGVTFFSKAVTLGGGGPVTVDVSAPEGSAVLSLLADRAEIPATPNAYTQTYSTANRTIAAPTGVAITDNTTGTASSTAAAGVGVYHLPIVVNLATVVDGDVLTAYVIQHKFKILRVDAYVIQEATTADKLTTLNVEIGSTDLTGGVVALTTANCTTLGAKIAGSAVTAANTGAAGGNISIEAASTTAFAEGQVVVDLTIQNMDTADAVASLILEVLHLIADDLDNRQTIVGAVKDLILAGIAT